jgi:hypothetical protein
MFNIFLLFSKFFSLCIICGRHVMSYAFEMFNKTKQMLTCISCWQFKVLLYCPKPCWWGERLLNFSKNERSLESKIFSRILHIVFRSGIGLYQIVLNLFLLCLGIGIDIACFQTDGRYLEGLNIILYMSSSIVYADAGKFCKKYMKCHSGQGSDFYI